MHMNFKLKCQNFLTTDTKLNEKKDVFWTLSAVDFYGDFLQGCPHFGE